MNSQKKYFEGPVCKKCNEILERSKTKNRDKLLNHITLGTFGFKRYHCWGCLKSKLLSKNVYSQTTTNN